VQEPVARVGDFAVAKGGGFWVAIRGFEQQFRVAWTGLQSDITGAIIKAMNTASKLLTAMRQNPNDWAMAKLLAVAKQYGMEVRSTGGSHLVFSHPSIKDPLSVPAHRPVKAIYIKRFVALIDQIQE
jgi:predicted RNA binding protein YcfA (HicA-like mRNA interferase family)